MKFHKGMILHEPEQGQNGDCYRTAIACLIDAPSPDYVPHFFEDNDLRGNDDARQWLLEQGYWIISAHWPEDLSYKQAIRNESHTNPGIPFLLSGKSSLSNGHTVVCQDGAIIHDPSPRNSGIVGPMEFSDGFVGYLVEYIVSITEPVDKSLPVPPPQLSDPIPVKDGGTVVRPIVELDDGE